MKAGNTTILVILILIAIWFISFSTRHRTEAGFQRNTLSAIQKVPKNRIRLIYIRWRLVKPVSLSSSDPKDMTDIKRLIKVIRELTVSSLEVNPGRYTPPVYDEIKIFLKSGEELTLYCWIGGKEKNPSLTLRSRTGLFKSTVQDIVRSSTRRNR